MRNISGTNNVRLNHGKYVVEKCRNKKTKYYGTFDTLIEALMFRDYCISFDWNVEPHHVNKKYDFPKYIKKHGAGFSITKILNGTLKYFGTFHTLLEAIEFRDYCVKYDWEVKPKRVRSYKGFNSYIYPNGGKFSIHKSVNSKVECFGTFNSLTDAYEERDKLMRANWDYDILMGMD